LRLTRELPCGFGSVPEVGWRYWLSRLCDLLGQLSLSCFSLRSLLEVRHHSSGPVTHCCPLPLRLLLCQALHCLPRHGGYWCLRRRRWCAKTYLVYPFCTLRINHSRYTSIIIG
jgi:hypothetical protein